MLYYISNRVLDNICVVDAEHQKEALHLLGWEKQDCTIEEVQDNTQIFTKFRVTHNKSGEIKTGSTKTEAQMLLAMNWKQKECTIEVLGTEVVPRFSEVLGKPKFKVGDRVRDKYCTDIVGTIVSVSTLRELSDPSHGNRYRIGFDGRELLPPASRVDKGFISLQEECLVLEIMD